MGKTAREKRSAGTPASQAGDGADGAAPKSSPGVAAAGEPAEPLERARLQAEVARQRVRIAKEELKRARNRMKEAKREAKRARKQAAVARKVWKRARRAHRGDSGPAASARSGRARPAAARVSPRKGAGRRRGAPITSSSQS
ncbi:MAG: hypothetical protein WBW93_08905 [Steroidobacteraceae bacterium]